MSKPLFRTLEPGMIADFVVRGVDCPDLVDLTEQIKWFCGAYCYHPYFIIDINPADWLCHLQISNRADAVLLRFGCRLEQFKPPEHLLQKQQEERDYFQTLSADQRRLEMDQLDIESPSRKAAWTPIPCMRCNHLSYYANDRYEDWQASGRIRNGVIIRHSDQMGHHISLNWRAASETTV